ncbi:MAG TPA: ABC transporter substrate-binding protein [Candidatus Bathyarchaeia archaeon]|nr:ABC transporter substrate-binding protein [Candidatus Bathyarchaeia archaeon]
MKKKIIAFLFIGFSLGLTLPILYCEADCVDRTIEPFFKINLLVPDGCMRQIQWVTLMLEQLPKIGIGIDTFEQASYTEILQRTYNYSGPYPIPTHDLGGYDILANEIVGDIDWDPNSLFHSSSTLPNGKNIYQYINQEMDWCINNYTSSYSLENRIKWINKIQDILYEDIPQITVLYCSSAYSFDTDFDNSSWNGFLWSTSNQPMENWSCGTQTEFKYASPYIFNKFHLLTYDSKYEAEWLHQIYNGMFERNPKSNNLYDYRLAEEVNTSDYLTYNIKIKNQAKWADGVPITSYDVNYTYSLLLNPNIVGTTTAEYWAEFLDISSIVIFDDNQYSITFKKPYVFQDSNLAIDILPKHIWENIPAEQQDDQTLSWALNNTLDSQKIIGAGPYYLEDYDENNYIIHLKRNNYFAEWSGIIPNFEDIYFIFYYEQESALADLSSGIIDMIDAQFNHHSYPTSPGIKNQFTDSVEFHEFSINNMHPILGTGELCPIAGKESARHIREAISHVIPREIIIDIFLEGFGVPGVTACPKGSIGYNNTYEPIEYSIEKALEHMYLAGYPTCATKITGIRDIWILIFPIITITLKWKQQNRIKNH